jgi:hypothetical protein
VTLQTDRHAFVLGQTARVDDRRVELALAGVRGSFPTLDVQLSGTVATFTVDAVARRRAALRSVVTQQARVGTAGADVPIAIRIVRTRAPARVVGEPARIESIQPLPIKAKQGESMVTRAENVCDSTRLDPGRWGLVLQRIGCPRVERPK